MASPLALVGWHITRITNIQVYSEAVDEQQSDNKINLYVFI